MEINKKKLGKLKKILKTKIDHSYSWNILYEGTKCARNMYLLEAFVCEVLDIVINQFERIQL